MANRATARKSAPETDTTIEANNGPSLFDIASETMAGDMRDLLLSRMRLLQKPVAQMSEGEQKTLAYDLEDLAKGLVRRCVRLIAAGPFETVTVTVGKFTVKDAELKAEFTCPDTDENLLRVKHAGHAVLVLADPTAYFGEKEPAPVDKDEPELPIHDPVTGEVRRNEDEQDEGEEEHIPGFLRPREPA